MKSKILETLDAHTSRIDELLKTPLKDIEEFQSRLRVFIEIEVAKKEEPINCNPAKKVFDFMIECADEGIIGGPDDLIQALFNECKGNFEMSSYMFAFAVGNYIEHYRLKRQKITTDESIVGSSVDNETINDCQKDIFDAITKPHQSCHSESALEECLARVLWKGLQNYVPAHQAEASTPKEDEEHSLLKA